MSIALSQVKEQLAEILGMKIAEINDEASLIIDLEADSLDIVDLAFSLGKSLKIVLPKLTLLDHAVKILGDEALLMQDNQLTQLGADLLLAGPNQFSKTQIKSGMNQYSLYQALTVQNWASLCEFIMESDSKDGDKELGVWVEQYLSEKSLTQVIA